MPELARQRADGVIDRSKTRDTPCFPLAAKGRLGVWNSHRGNHLGQRSCASAKTGRTYGRKRSDQSTAQITLRGGGRPALRLSARGSIMAAPPLGVDLVIGKEDMLLMAIARSRTGRAVEGHACSWLIGMSRPSLRWPRLAGASSNRPALRRAARRRSVHWRHHNSQPRLLSPRGRARPFPWRRRCG